MAKSNRRRKQDRAKRATTSAQRNAAADRRRAAADAAREAERRLELLSSPDTPAGVVAETLRAHYGPMPRFPGLAQRLAAARGSDLLDVADAVRDLELADGGAPSLFGLTFRAGVYHLTGDQSNARRLLDEAFASAADLDARLAVASHLRYLGRAIDVLDFLTAQPQPPAYEWTGSALHRYALEDAARHVAECPSDQACACGTGAAYGECCRPREMAALVRFADRSGMDALRAAVEQYLPHSAYAKPFAEYVGEWLDETTDDPWEAPSLHEEGLARMAAENGWLLAHARDDADEDDDEDDDEDNVLAALAADPATPPDIAHRALAWLDARYGLWQVTELTSGPGVPCLEVCTGHELYVNLSAEQARDLPRWAVLMGPVAPLDGAWRAGAMMQLSPEEADAICDTVQAATDAVFARLLGEPRRDKRRPDEPSPFGRADPHTVYAYLEDSAEPEIADVISKLLANLTGRFVAEVAAVRATPPGLANTDGESLCLITARIAVRDGKGLAVRLEAHPDVEPEPDEVGRFLWQGQEVPAAQRAAMVAELRAQLAADGHADPDLQLDDEPSRWARGRLLLRGSEITAEVNSRERLAGLLDLLATLGAEPALVDQTHVDPRQDLAWPAGPRALPGGLAPAEEGWEKSWLDEAVPALRGRTPRQAARGPERELLEALLRRFEHDADVLATDGRPGVDTAWLREQVGMADWWSGPAPASGS